MSEPLYNLIMHYSPEFWLGDSEYVDFSKDRFLEHTDEDVREKFKSLDDATKSKLLKLPTLFATEQEEADTRIGKITKIEEEPRNLRIYFKFENKYAPLTKGALQSPELGLNLDSAELYRTHWAIKKANLSDFLQQRSNSFEGVLDKIKQSLDTPNPKKPNGTKISVLYASNASGKTRLSRFFAEQYDKKIVYYNAFTEDLFNWDNENYVLRIDNRAWIFRFILEQGLDRQIVENFQKFTSSKLEPEIDILNNQIIFGVRTGGDDSHENIKISRGEESIFIWSVFYTVLKVGIGALNTSEEGRETKDFDEIQYIVIDDPVSSMDDTRIITVALELANLLSNSKNQLKFLVTTHHALFFNVLFNARGKNWDRKNYILSKSGEDYILKTQGNDSPFAYHHVAMAEIEKAINDNDIKKYHFNIFRALLEKTANFLGLDHWKKCLEGGAHREEFTKIIDHYSHNRLSDLEYKDITNEEKEEFKASFEFFMNKYFKQGVNTNE